MPKLLNNLPLALLSVALLVGIVWVYRVWQETHEDDDEPDATPEDLLQQFRDAHAAGELDDEEFQRVRALLKTSTLEPSGERGVWDRNLDLRDHAKADPSESASDQGTSPPEVLPDQR